MVEGSGFRLTILLLLFVSFTTLAILPSHARAHTRGDVRGRKHDTLCSKRRAGLPQAGLCSWVVVVDKHSKKRAVPSSQKLPSRRR